MQEEADRIRAAHRAQFGGERNELVVVHPDDVVGTQQRAQLAREQLVDAAITVREAPVELREIEPVVKYRPQHVVRITEVIRVVVLRIEIDRRELNAADVLNLHFATTPRPIFVGAAQPAAPAEPHAARLLQAILDRNGETACSGFTRVGNAIRDDDEAAHQFS